MLRADRSDRVVDRSLADSSYCRSLADSFECRVRLRGLSFVVKATLRGRSASTGEFGHGDRPTSEPTGTPFVSCERKAKILLLRREYRSWGGAAAYDKEP